MLLNLSYRVILYNTNTSINIISINQFWHEECLIKRKGNLESNPLIPFLTVKIKLFKDIGHAVF